MARAWYLEILERIGHYDHWYYNWCSGSVLFLDAQSFDYWYDLDITYYDDEEDFFRKNEGEDIYYFSTKAPQIYTDVVYPENSFIMFGKESRGLPEELLFAHPSQCVRIPMRDSLRSLNLSNSVAIAVYEILRQDQFEGLQVDGKLTRFDWSDAN